MLITEHTLPELPELPPRVKPAVKGLADCEHASPAGKRRLPLLAVTSTAPSA